MDYGALIKRTLSLSWTHKTLWVLGYFTMSLYALGSLSNKIKSEDKPFFLPSGDLADFLNINWDFSAIMAILGLIGLFIALVTIVLFILQLICIAGLIEAVYRIENGKSYKLKELLAIGLDHFWSYLGLFFVFFIIIGAYVVVLIALTILPIVLLGGFGVLVLMFVIPLGIAGIFIGTTIYSLAQREIVIGHAPVFEAIGEGYKLLSKHLGPNIIIAFINLFLEIVIVISGLIIIASFALPLIFIWAQSITILTIIGLVMLVPVFILVSIVIEGFLGTFFNTLFTLFYMKLRKLTPKSSTPEPTTP